MTSLRVTGKGAKERMIYLNDACRAALSDYLPLRMKEEAAFDKPQKALFLSSRKNRISVKTVQWMVYKYLDDAGLGGRHLSVHKLRHTAATLMLQNGVDVRTLQEVLGHDHLNTTQIYTHISSDDLKIAARANPLSDARQKKGS